VRLPACTGGERQTAPGYGVGDPGLRCEKSRWDDLGLVRLFLCLAALLGAASACATDADLSRHYDAATGSFCGISVGRAIPPQMERRSIWIEPEGMREERFVVELCEDAVTGQLALGEDGTIEAIIFTTPGYCLNGVCIGDRFPQVRNRHPDLEIFLTREEGGLLSLHEAPGAVGYPFDAGRTPIRCFGGIDICPTAWSAARVSAIVIGSR
jgi:hypothetical protein